MKLVIITILKILVGLSSFALKTVRERLGFGGTRHTIETMGACSSVWQSSRLIIYWSKVQILAGPPFCFALIHANRGRASQE